MDTPENTQRDLTHPTPSRLDSNQTNNNYADRAWDHWSPADCPAFHLKLIFYFPMAAVHCTPCDTLLLRPTLTKHRLANTQGRNATPRTPMSIFAVGHVLAVRSVRQNSAITRSIVDILDPCPKIQMGVRGSLYSCNGLCEGAPPNHS
jgi:hypothetical protein